MLPNVPPKVAAWLNFVYLTLTALSAPALEGAGVSHNDALHVMAIAALAALPLNILLHMVSAPVAGPLTK